MRTTRTNLGLLFGLVALVLFGVIAGAFSSEADLSRLENQRELIGNGTFAAAFAALIGVMAITSEFRHGTIRATFLVNPARTRVVAAKVTASIIFGIAFGALGSGLALATSLALIRARGYHVLIDAGECGGLCSGLWSCAHCGQPPASAWVRSYAIRCSRSSVCSPGSSSSRS
jgi:ABC-2 type transport system permease protein